MPSEITFLDKIDIAAPCSVPWEEMAGDERKRFCSQCRKNVYNLSDMTRTEAETLLRESGGRNLCTMFYRRSDGTILTDNCPVGLRTVRNAIVRRWVAVASLAAALCQWSRPAEADEPPTAASFQWSRSAEAGSDVSIFQVPSFTSNAPKHAIHYTVGSLTTFEPRTCPVKPKTTKAKHLVKGRKTAQRREVGKVIAKTPPKAITEKKRTQNTKKDE